ncbi:family transcriptional regulator : Transcriptional regulators-like protein OS=Pirellula staleyi (strain ATCC 27377 / DSM 6068 / ICPB 4128) GN=Psta_4678 PE=4 SV=1: GntR: Peripla_BP_3 [Gemmataceae bacterium]|nr:family transcriptional regulator : Transcriptional regulators-like protein OS=Pirellula staleyi (strain ATCC 27377 / DSM 6068 / ICPB 4128) GN=Psta_4678 PE=4 SV=1: GntR: Peripla_BP_3 [Gemmataceae bacterium]VTU02569.1 family transcriptional regulator : Transcriptional regulators-like protein OS=Pirellula staleyi (strain ATCC 27377 / DSM 6068 / ICPB 4128) GN=Psta_4678 PE=4 SV=1: GntR: Peripla_BP_3 [Gemmataceae bacterium]
MSDAPKHLVVSRQIEAHIREGRWPSGRLPGVRALAADYDTSVVTASRALQELAIRGLVDTVERSGCYVRAAAPDAPAAGETWGLCLRLTPGPWLRATEAVIRDGFAGASRRGGSTVRGLELAADGSEADLVRQVRDAKAAGVTGLFFLPSRATEAAARQDEVALRACAAVKLPVVLIERNLRGDRPLAADLVAYDDLEAGRVVTRHVLETGRRRPAFVLGSPTSSHQARLAGYLLEAHAAGVPPCVVEQPAELAPKEAYGAVADQLLAARADAAVCYQDYTAVGVILELLTRGTRVPADVAVTGFEDLPIGNTFSLGVTTFAFSYDEMARRALRLMRDRVRNPNDLPVRVAVGGQLVVRESTRGREPK